MSLEANTLVNKPEQGQVEPIVEPQGQQLKQPQSWRDSLPDDLKADPTLAKYNSVDEVAKAYLNINKLIGKEKIVIPKEGDSEEVWDMFYKANGRPESSDKYDVSLPEGIELDEQIEADYREAFYKAGYSQKQVNALLEVREREMQAYQERRQREAEENFKQGHTALRRELGDKYNDALQGAQRVFKELATPELADKLEKTGLANDPEFVKLGIAISKMIGDDSFANVPSVGMNASKAQEEISAIKNGGAYYDASHPEHKQALSRVKDLLGYID